MLSAIFKCLVDLPKCLYFCEKLHTNSNFNMVSYSPINVILFIREPLVTETRKYHNVTFVCVIRMSRRTS